MPPTKEPETIADYRRRALQMRDRVARIRGQNPGDLLPIHLVEHLLGRAHASESRANDAPDRHQFPHGAGLKKRTGVDSAPHAGQPSTPGVISKSTFRQYKAALLSYFEQELETAPTRYDAELLQSAIDRLNSAPQTPFAKRGSSGSALKSKKFHDAEFGLVLTAVEAGIAAQRRWATGLKTFLEANRLAGLRPCEWEDASIRPSSPGSEDLVLVVRNAKHTNGRGNGPIRTLQLDSLNPQEMDALHEMVQLMERLEAGQILGEDGRPITFAHFHKNLRDYLRRITRKVFPAKGRRQRWPTLYSLRHQVCADAKMSGSSQAEVAALMGHRSDATAGQHYGKTRTGINRPRSVKPSADDVATVRARARIFAPKPGG